MKRQGNFSVLTGAAAAFTWSLVVGTNHTDIAISGSNSDPQAFDFTLVGLAKVLRRGLVGIGDIDGNGVADFAWLSPRENNSAGALRLYLMETATKTLFIRHIIPGKWGFDGHTLSKDDPFGESVTPIGDVNGDGVQDIAVGAPGDSVTGKAKGAVYVLLLKKDGSVLSSEKMSALTDLSLSRQQVAGEGFGSNVHSVQDVNGNDVKELSVESKDGSRTMILLSKTGKSISALKLAIGVDPKALEPRLSEAKIRVMPLRLNGMDSKGIFSSRSLKTAVTNNCFFNETHCACGAFPSSAVCLQAVGMKQGMSLCLQRPCQAGYRCDCEGEKCASTEKPRSRATLF